MREGRKILSFLLAAAMLFGSIYLPGGIVRAEDANVASGKTVTVSSVESAMPGNTGDQVVDESSTTRWSCNAMKTSSTTETDTQTPQWLVIDLAAEKTQVTSLSIYFYKKVWAAKYQIQTADTNTADTEWVTVKSIERASGSLSDDPTDTFTDVTELKRYVRFYFEKVNVNAGGTGVSITEIEIMGTQEGILSEPEDQTTFEYSRNFADGNIEGIEALYGTAASITAADSALKIAYSTQRAGVVDKNITQQAADGIFEATVVPQQDGVRFGLIMRATDENNKLYVGTENGSGSWFWEYWKNGSNTWGTIHSSTTTLSANTEAHIKVKLVGNKVTLWVNDVQIFSDTMSGSPLLTPGYFGFDKSVSAGTFLIQDIKVTGIQADSASGVLNSIAAIQSPSVQDTKITLPEVAAGYEIAVVGSEKENIISNDGTIVSHNIGDQKVTLLVEVKSTIDEEDKARRNFDVVVPSKNSFYPDMFPEVNNPNEEPEVIPSLQEWYGYEGTFTLTDASRIVINDAANVGLQAAAENMQEDLTEISGRTLPIVSGTSGDEDDIYIESQSQDTYEVGEEGYLLVTSENGIKIYSSTYTGCLYGTITVEQILWQDDGNDNVPCGVIRDYPDYEIRGVMFDVGRIPHRLQYLKDYTKILTWYKMNEFHLHLNDDFDYNSEALATNWSSWTGVHRLESDTFPSLTDNNVYTGDKFDYFNEEYADPFYTKDEFRELEKLANSRGIDLLAELDTPSHSTAYINYANENPDNIEWLGTINTTTSSAANNRQMLALDTESSNAAERENALRARRFIEELYDDYLGGDDPVFTSDTVHVGADEYWDKSNPEAFRKYVNFLSDLMESYGKTARMWGAQLLFPGTTEISPDNIVLDVWATYEEDPIARMEEGYRVVNVPQQYLYTTPGRDHKDMVGEEYLFKYWDPTIFNQITSPRATADVGEPLLLGAKAALWGDEFREGITEADTHERMLRAVAITAEKTWGGTDEDDEYIDYQQTFDRLKEGPGTEIAKNIKSESEVVVDYDLTETKTEDKKITVTDESGNGYDAVITNGEIVTEDGKSMVKFDGTTVMTTPLTTLDYPYTVSFDVKASSGNTEDSLLFSGYDGWLQADGSDGNITIKRSFYTQSSGYEIPTDKTVNVTIVGTFQNTKIYVDGELVKMFYSTDSGHDSGKSDEYFTTFVFPLEEIGKNFHGYIGNIKAYNKAMQPDMIDAEALEVTEVNVALNANAYAERFGSSPALNSGDLKRHPAWKATDGDKTDTGSTGTSTDPNSYWLSSNNNADYLMVDLGEEKSINKVVVNWEGSNYASAFAIEISSDGETWERIKEISGNTSAVSTINLDAPKTTRYVKMQGITRNGTYYAVRELEVFQTVDKSTLKEKIAAAESVIRQDNLEESELAEAQALIRQVKISGKVLDNPFTVTEKAEAFAQNIQEKLDAYEAAGEEPEPPVVDPEPPVSLPYKDVTENDWFYDYVYDVYVKELMTGLNETTFGPAQGLVRAQFAVIVYRMEGSPEVAFDANKFPDVPAGQFYSEAVIWAAENGIVTGYTSNGHFGPNDPITREQMATMMFRYANYKKMDTSEEKDLSSFPDGGSVQAFAKDAMEWCTAKGIISGKGNEPKILDPQGSTSRAECATIISRYTDIK